MDILCVDDETSLLEITKLFLEKDGDFNVHVVDSVGLALEALESRKYDAIVSDYLMPETDGIEFLKSLRKSGDRTPFILFTGKGREEVAIEALNSGADYYLSKGGDPKSQFAELANMVKQAVARKNAEETLRRSEERYRTTLDNMIEGCQIIGSDWRYLYLNDAAASHGHKRKDELLGHTMMEIYPGIENTQMFAALRECMERQVRRRLENEFTYPDGSKAWFILNIEPVPEGTFILSIDITERKRAEDMLLESEEHFRTLIENASDIIAVIDALGTIRFLSPSVERAIGYRPEELVGRNVSEIVHPDDLEHSMISLTKAATGEVSRRMVDLRFRRKDGSWCPIEAVGSMSHGKNGNAGDVVVNGRDVTERKLANSKLEQLNRILRAIRGVNELMIKVKDRDDLLQGICEELVKTKGLNDAWIALFDRDGRFAAAYSAGTGKQFQNLMTMLRQGETPHCMSEALERRDTILSYEGYDACTDCPASNMYPGKIVLTSVFESDDGNYGVLSVSLPSSLAIEEGKTLVKEVADDIAFALSGIELEAERRRIDDSLRESETFFSKAFSTSPLPVSIASVETGKIIKVNDSFSRTFKYGCEELVGRSALELGLWITPEDRRKFVGKLKEQGSVQGMPIDGRTKCGDSIKALIFAEPFDFKGESCILSTIIDLTQLNEMEKMLEESTRSYKELTDSIGDVFFAMDKDLRYTYWNKASERLTGIKADYAIGRSLFELFPENEESNATKAYKKALATGTEQTFLNEYRIKDKDYFFEITVYPSERGLSVFVKDVTERMKAETNLALSESRYRRLFDCMSSGVAVYEARDNGTCFVIKDINIAAQRIENVRKEEITGRCVSEVFPGVKEFGLFDVFKRVWETGVPEHFHAAMYKDDRISGWRDNFVYRLSSGEIVAVYEDVTDRVTTEKTKEAVFDISEATSSTIDIQDLYVRIHRILEGLMPVRNIFIALHDALTDTLSFPYFVDERDPTPAPRKAGRGLAEYVLRTGRPLLASAQDVQELADRGEIDIIGTIPVCGVGVPLLIEGRTIGVIVIQSYDEEFEYVERDRDVLYYVSNEVAMAIERKNSEKALKESEEKYRNLVEKANDGIAIIQDGVVRYTNPKLVEMGGYTVEETIGKPFTDFIWPEDVPKLADHYKRRMRGEKVPSTYEARFRGKGGECLYTELNTTVIEYQGRPADFAIIRDLSNKIEAQEALRRSEQKYRTIFETTGTAMITIEKDRTISLANEEAQELTGYSKEEIEGRMKIEDFVADEDIKRLMRYHDLRRKDAGLAPHGYETSIKNKRGGVRTVWVTIDVIPETKQSVASLIDITEVRKLERKLSEKAQEQTLLLDNIETMVWYAADPETYGPVNRARAGFLGKKKEELEGKKIWEILPPEEAKVGVMGNRIAFEEKRIYRGDEWVTTARGEKRCVAVTKIPKLDADGNVQFVVCTGHDITESKMLEKKLNDKSNEQALLLDNIQTMVYFATDPETHGKMNQARADFFGKSKEEMEGTKISEIMPKDRAENAIAGNRYVFETKTPYHGLEWYTNWKGEKHLFSVTKVPKPDEKGNVEFVICSAHDVTDLEETRNALSLANKKLNLLGSVTRHDILNQLTVITGGLGMAEGIVKEERARKLMDMALNASRSIEKYLGFSRDLERMGTAKPEWIDAKEACMKGMSTLETGDVDLVVDLDGLEIYADKLLEKVFHNLIGNALKHGGKVSTVHMYSRREDGHMVLVCEDDGNGIPKDKKKSILEGRYGRGLYLVKEILGITGMTIIETGEEGRGARFEISVPEGNHRLKDR